MSILSSLFTATSGLNAHGAAIGVVGDNIANTSTVGFKASRAEFKDVLGGFAGDAKRLGAGVRMGGLQTAHTQGSMLSTGRVFDMAVNGDGFFVVRGGFGNTVGEFYTRNGQFELDEEGFLVNTSGLRLQGYDISPDGNRNTVLGDLQIGVNQSAPTATTTLDLELNLEAAAVAPTPAFDPADPDSTSNFATSVSVYDSLGTEHKVQMFFRSQGGGAWEWHAMVDGGELDGGTPGELTSIASGNVGFTSDGALDTETVTTSSANFLGATPGQAIAFDFGDAITTDGGTGVAGTTQFDGASTINSLIQDGNGFGSLVDVSISEDGTIVGSFSNGERREVGQVALATFASNTGLERAGDQLFAETVNSGQPLIDVAGANGRALSAGSLESSNVDLGGELVTLIAYQRAFQANARTISTSDELLAEVANLKR